MRPSPASRKAPPGLYLRMDASLSSRQPTEKGWEALTTTCLARHC